jgi:hypothetical protein
LIDIIFNDYTYKHTYNDYKDNIYKTVFQSVDLLEYLNILSDNFARANFEYEILLNKLRKEI